MATNTDRRTYSYEQVEYMLRYRRAFERQRALERFLWAFPDCTESADVFNWYYRALDQEAAEAQLRLDMFLHDHRGMGLPTFFPDDIANAIDPDAPVRDI